MKKNRNKLDIIFQDEEIVVVNKDAGMLSVPGRGPEKQDCVVKRLKEYLPNCIEQPSVHRLDMDTSGLMVLALNSQSHRHLSIQFQEKQVTKKYCALLEGELSSSSGKIELPFRLDPNNRPYQIYDPEHGKSSLTYWHTIGREGDFTRVEFRPVTGRTHQLRVHSSHPLGLNAPIVGDRLYGQRKTTDRMLLHATYLSFSHPGNGNLLEFESPAQF